MSIQQTTAISGKLPNVAASYLSPSRMELADWVRGYAPSLAELYLGALRMMDDTSIPGRVVLICHAVREICNRLPGRVSGEESGGRLDYTWRVEVIAKAWVGSALPLDGAVPIPAGATASPVSEQAAAVQIPSYLFVPMAELVRDHLNGRSKPEQTAMRLFKAAAPEGGAMSAPALAQWLKTREWFVAHAHDSGRLDADVDPNELETHFGVFEQTLMSLGRGFYKSLDDVDAILDAANR